MWLTNLASPESQRLCVPVLTPSPGLGFDQVVDLWFRWNFNLAWSTIFVGTQ